MGAPLPPRLTIALLWAGAVVALLALWLGRPDAPRPATGGVVVRAPEDAPGPTPDVPPLRAGPPSPSPGTHRLDPRGLGRSDAFGPGSPTVAFRFEAGARITAQAVVDAEGRVYVGDHGGTFHVFDRFGNPRWSRRLGGPIWSTALVDADGVVVGSDAGELVAWDRDGAERWRVRVGAEVDTGIRAVPGTDELRVAAGRSLLAVRRADGRVRWRFEAREKIFTTPAVAADGAVVFGAQDDRVYAVGPDGALRWAHRTGGDVDGSPVLADDGAVFVGADDGRVHAIGPRGRPRWSAELGGYVRAPLALAADGAVLAAVYGPRPRVVCLEPADGAVRWSFLVTLADSSETGIASGPVVDAAGRVYFGAHDDFVYAVSPDGALRWVVPTEGDVDAAPVLAPDGTLYVGSEDGRVYAIRDAG